MSRAFAGAALCALAAAQMSSPSPIAVPSPLPMPCTVSDHGATYDLSALAGLYPTDGFPAISDAARDQYQYYYNVCNDIVPRSATGTLPCAGLGPAPAYQIDTSKTPNSCVKLGASLTNPPPSTPFPGAMTVFADTYGAGGVDRLWARGVELRYSFGDACPGTGLLRNVTILFQCASGVNSHDEATVAETTSCSYYIVIKSRAGCPLECGGGGITVCSGNGVCGYDATNGKAKCYCNENWANGDAPCSRNVGVNYVAPKKNYGPNIAGGFFGGIFLGAFLVAAFFVIRAKMTGGTFYDALDFTRVFGTGSSSGNAPYTFSTLSGGPSSTPAAAFVGSASDGYAPPDVAAPPPGGMAAAYAASGSDYSASLA